MLGVERSLMVIGGVRGLKGGGRVAVGRLSVEEKREWDG